MKSKKNNTPKPAETDFFAEALKAFEVPSFQTEQKPEAEENAETVPQPKKNTFLRKWWPAILCCAVCAVLLIRFLPGNQNVDGRGESWIYGTLASAEDDSLVITDLRGNHWLVVLDGLESPRYEEEGLWVFYNGAAKIIEEKSQGYTCTRKITATKIRTNRWYSSSEYPDYGQISDEIRFDIDGDGEEERWLIYRYSFRLDPVYSVPSIALKRPLNLVAMDSEMKVKYHVQFLPPTDDTYIFCDHGGVLSMISTMPDQTLQIRLENGGLSVYYGEEQLSSLGIETQPTETEPPHTYEIQFALTSPFNMEEVAHSGEWQTLPYKTGKAFQEGLEKLSWEEMKFGKIYQYAGFFDLKVDGEESIYYFTHDGWLMHDGQCAQMSDVLRQDMVSCMGHTVPAYTHYRGTTLAGAPIDLQFMEDGTYRLSYTLPFADAETVYIDNYGTIGNALYLPIDIDSMGAFVLVENEDFLHYWKDGSNQTLLVMEDYAVFCDANAITEISFGVYDSGDAVATEDLAAQETRKVELTPTDMQELKRLISECQNRTYADWTKDEITGFFALHEGTVERPLTATYALTRNGKWVSGDQMADVSEELSAFLLRKMRAAGEYIHGSQFLGENRDGQEVELWLSGNSRSFQMIHPGGTILPDDETARPTTYGTFMRVGDILRLYPGTLCTEFIQLRVHEEGSLVYMEEMSNTDMDHRLIDGAILTNMLSFTSVDIEIKVETGENGSSVTLGGKDLAVDLDMAPEAYRFLRSLHWEALRGAPEGAYMGSFDFSKAYAYLGVYSGKKLVSGNYEANLTDEQWNFVRELMQLCGDKLSDYCEAVVNDKTYTLNVSGNQRFTLTASGKTLLEGEAVFLKGYTFLYGDDGQCITMLLEDKGYVIIPSHTDVWSFALPDDTIFEQIWEAAI